MVLHQKASVLVLCKIKDYAFSNEIETLSLLILAIS